MSSPPRHLHHHHHHHHHRNRRLLSPSPPPPPPLHHSSTDVPAAAAAAAAVTTPPSSSSRSAIPMLLPVFILFIILLGFLSIFLFRDFLHFTSILLSSSSPSSRQRRRSAGNGGQQESDDVDGGRPEGLDPAILASFPTLPYSAVRGLQEGKCGQECAVCLGEFAGGDVIRLLTVCCHAFHPPCIDSWLAAHATCPVCRSDLQAPPDEAAVLAVREAVGDGQPGAASEDDGEEGSRRMTKTRSGARHAITIDDG